MKAVMIALFVATMIILGFFVFRFGNIGNSKTEETWDTSDGRVFGTWGTSIEIIYTDGSTETLNPLDITFKDKKVSSFQYVLFSKMTSETYGSVDLVFSDFGVSATVINQGLGELGTKIEGNLLNLGTDNTWNEVYRIVVDADVLEVLETDQTYNLSFVPSGSIQYHESASSNSFDILIPGSFWINFKVGEEVIDDDGDGDGSGDKWIQVDIGGETQ